MTSIRIRRHALLLAAVALSATLIGGCAGKNKTVKGWRDDANNRWLEMRSGMMLDMAQQAFDTGDLDRAEKELNQALALDPGNDRLQTLGGRIALERGRLEKAFHHFELAIKKDTPEEKELKKGVKPTNSDARYYQAVVLQRWKRFDDALQRYTEAYEIKPDQPNLLMARCEMLVELDRIDEAIELLNERLGYFDQSAGVRAMLGHIHMLRDDPEQAVSFFTQASLLDPENLKIREELTRAQFAAGQYREAAKNVVKLRQHPDLADRVDLRRLEAQAYLKMGRTLDARRIYLDLTRTPNVSVTDWITLGQMAWQDQDPGGALSAATRAIKLDPKRHEAYILAGMVWQKRGNIDEALRNFDRAADYAPDDAVPLILRGIALQKDGRAAAAADAYTQALQREPGDARALKLLKSVAVPTP